MKLKLLPMTIATITALNLMLVSGCATQPQVVTDVISGSGTAKLYPNKALPHTMQNVGDSDPKMGNAQTWGAFAFIPWDQVEAVNRGFTNSFIGFGIANNRTTQEEAKNAALTMCKNDGKPGCKVRYVFQGQCFAFLFAPDNSFSYSWMIAPPDKAIETSEKIYQKCLEKSENKVCYSFYVSCPNSL